MQPEPLAQVTNATGFPSTLAEARQRVRADLLDNPLGYPPQDMLDRTLFQADLGPGERLWDQVWDQLKFRSGPDAPQGPS